MRSRRFSQAEMCWCIHASVACRACGSILQVRTRPIFSELISPLCSRTRTCLSSDGRANSNGSESSLTDFGPSHKRLTIARLVGSASAEKALFKSVENLAITESIDRDIEPVKKNFHNWLSFRSRFIRPLPVVRRSRSCGGYPPTAKNCHTSWRWDHPALTRPEPSSYRRGRTIHAPASVSSAKTAGPIASQLPAAAIPAVPAHRIDDRASVSVATRDDVWRRRNMLRFA